MAAAAAVAAIMVVQAAMEGMLQLAVAVAAVSATSVALSVESRHSLQMWDLFPTLMLQVTDLQELPSKLCSEVAMIQTPQQCTPLI
jgi:hypothetical protein